MKNSFEITHNTVFSNRIKKPVRIAQITDLHDCLYGSFQSELTDAVMSLKPDFIACTGDLFNRKKPFCKDNATCLIKNLLRIFPVFIVEGNHEARLGEAGDRYLNDLEAYGARILRNEAVDYDDIHIIGLVQRPCRTDLAGLISERQFNLVLSHRPELFPMYVSCGSDLVLSGHAHGGQVRIGKLALIAPQQGVFPKYTSGMYQSDFSRMFVSKGLGDTVVIPRINNPHELALICLIPE